MPFRIHSNPSWKHGFARYPSQSLYPDLWRGLIGAWSMGLGPTGLTTLYDISPLKNNGTLNGAMTISDWVISQGRYALEFDGVNDHIDLGNDASLEVGFPITFMAWINHRGANSFRAIAGTVGTGGNRYAGFLLQISNSDKIGIHFGNDTSIGGGSRRSKGGTTAIPINTWTHIAGVLTTPSGNNTEMTIYVNGVDDGGTFSGGATTMVYGGNSHLINTDGSMWGGQQELDGLIDDVFIYNRFLSPVEVRKLYLLGRGGIFIPRVSIFKSPAAAPTTSDDDFMALAIGAKF